MNRQLADCEEMFAEFDKKCTGLELLTAPLSVLRPNCLGPHCVFTNTEKWHTV